MVLCADHFLKFIEAGGKPQPITITPQLYGLLSRGCDFCNRTYDVDEIIKMLTDECGFDIQSDIQAEGNRRITFRKRRVN